MFLELITGKETLFPFLAWVSSPNLNFEESHINDYPTNKLEEFLVLLLQNQFKINLSYDVDEWSVFRNFY